MKKKKYIFLILSPSILEPEVRELDEIKVKQGF